MKNTKTVKTIFIGTSEFAVPILERCIGMDELDVVALVTQPDRPVGRKKVLTPPVTKQYLVQNSESRIQIEQPEKLRNVSQEILAKYEPELIIVASYGQFIPNDMLEYPKYGCLNVHGSVLPKLRGAVPIPMSIWHGFEKTGVSLQVMSEEMDAGDVIASDELRITDEDTTGTLTAKLSELGAELVEDAIPKWIRGEIEAKPQDESKATFCYMRDIAKENAEIDWTRPVDEIERMARALNPWPLAYTKVESEKLKFESFEDKIIGNKKFDGQKVQFHRLEVLNEYNYKKPAKFLKYGKKLVIRAPQGMLRIDECKVQGKQKMNVAEPLFLADEMVDRVRAIVIKDDKILVIQRNKEGQQYYSLPGGGVNIGESFEDAVVREVREETGINVEIIKKTFENLHQDKVSKEHYFECNIINTNRKIKQEGLSKENNTFKARWLQKNGFEELNNIKNLSSYIKLS